MKTELRPGRVTKPLQLLAAWLVGLIAIDGAFLTAARFLVSPPWLPALLVISAVANVPLFLACLFLLQTRFRPQMQEDIYYSQYLETTRQHENPIGEIERLRTDISETQSKTLSLLDSVQQQVVAVVDAMGSTRQQSSGALATAKSLIPAAQQGLADTKQDLAHQRYAVAVNDLLPNYARIVQGLSAAGIGISQTFGSSSTEPKVPRVNLLTIGNEVAPEFLRLVLKAGGTPDFISHAPQDYSNRRVYFGSYGYESQPIAPFDRVAPVIAGASLPSEIVAAILENARNL